MMNDEGEDETLFGGQDAAPQGASGEAEASASAADSSAQGGGEGGASASAEEAEAAPSASAAAEGASDADAADAVVLPFEKPKSVSVCDPQQKGGFLKSWVVYRVATDPNGFSVQRRYSDFVWLRNKLMQNFVGILVPPLPEKKVMKSATFQKIRMRELNLFINAVCKSDYLCADPALHDFLSVQEDSAWEKVKAATEDSRDNSGAEQWRKALNEYTAPENAERLLLDVRRQLEQLEATMTPLITSVKALEDRCSEFAYTVYSVAGPLAALEKCEDNIGNKSKVEYPSKSAPAMKASIQSMRQVFSQWYDLQALTPDINSMLFYEVLKYEQMKVSALSELLKSRDAMIEKHSRLVKRQDQLQSDYQKAAQRADAQERAAKAKITFDDAAAAVKRSKYAIDFMTRGLFFCELERFNASRCSTFNEMAGTYAAAYMKYGSRMQGMWNGFLSEIEGDPQSAMEGAKSVLQSAQEANDASKKE